MINKIRMSRLQKEHLKAMSSLNLLWTGIMMDMWSLYHLVYGLLILIDRKPEMIA